MTNNYDEKESVRDEEVPVSRTLVPPEAKLVGITTVEDQPHVASPLQTMTPKLTAEISTPNKADSKHQSAPNSNGLEPIDLNIVNLESSNDLRLDEKAQSSPSFRDFGKDIEVEHRRTASASNIPTKTEDPEDRMGNGRQYSLDLCAAAPQDHVIIEIEQERARKGNERKFKIIMGLLIFGILFTVTFFMMAYELGYLTKSDTFSTPVFY